MSPGLVTFGEALASFRTSTGKLRHATSVDVGIAGTEATVAVGVSRLGARAAWAGRIGADEPGALVLTRLREEGVDTSAAVTDAHSPTGLVLRDFRSRDANRSAFYRTGSAGTRIAPEDLREDLIAGAGVLHLSGATAALSETADDATFAAAEIAGEAGVPVSLSLDHRPALWHPEDARDTLLDLVSHADIVFARTDEARLLGFDGDADSLVADLAALGPDDVIVMQGPRGAVAEIAGARYDVPSYPVHEVDPDAADEAFVAGYLADLLAGEPADRRVRTAAACRAAAMTVPGGADSLPERGDLVDLPRQHRLARQSP
ncbi:MULTISPECIES: sugar kinase [Prauserella salsuginis group]|uniref:2-dehydro-3-deoxygluconokinase n=2 Tax=Prauserella salsuginis group TaxID=2893672 RepID=A0A839XIE7_9PSEU|nr:MULTISPECIES: sugar kinase [Prauserella salsuginis group]MBB3661334.1 2-dehydro-3-deoxygluconokinase [Prauserella sediminis]MCR3719256.1 2-dehydro-3-deoxygluconokinase [Prauserella flava]MCR3735731.1 2-dehydro-3-deoxygluconokinase [Prauserella salsuginis]